MQGSLTDLAATGIASEPTLRKWLDGLGDQPWILKRGSRGDAYVLDLAGAIAAWRGKEEAEIEAARARADQINQLKLELGLTGTGEKVAGLSAAERKQLLEEELLAMQVARKRGELVPFAEVAAAWGDVLVRVRQQRESFATRLAKKVDLSREQIEQIERQMDADGTDLAEWMEKMEAEAASHGDGAPDPGEPERRGATAATGLAHSAAQDRSGAGALSGASSSPAG